MADFDVTLIFCTYGRTAEVAEFFRALARDTEPDLKLQILVVDQNPEDLLSAVLAPYRERWTIRHIRTDIRGISPARNLALGLIEGEIVAFPDDDCLYLDHTLQNVRETFREHPEAGVVMGIWSDIAAPDFSGKDSDRPVNRFSLFKKGEAPVKVEVDEAVDAYGAELEYFADCVQKGEETKEVSNESVRDVLEVILAMKESLETGKVIDM